MADDTSCCDLAGLCERSGVVDALVFRRVSSTTWAHLGGLGRGRGWAGVVEVGDGRADAGRLRPGRSTVVAHSAPAHVIGPYYATGAAAVRLTNDVLVVLGNPDRAAARAHPDGRAPCTNSRRVSTTTWTRSARPSGSVTNSRCCTRSAP